MLQKLFAKFDRDSTKYKLYKLCTIGDAYVAVSEPVTEDNEVGMQSTGCFLVVFPVCSAERIASQFVLLQIKYA